MKRTKYTQPPVRCLLDCETQTKFVILYQLFAGDNFNPSCPVIKLNEENTTYFTIKLSSIKIVTKVHFYIFVFDNE